MPMKHDRVMTAKIMAHSNHARLGTLTECSFVEATCRVSYMQLAQQTSDGFFTPRRAR